MSEYRSLKGTVVAITGASAGVGRATARDLVQAGARVVLGARRKERLDALVEELGGSEVAVAVVGDVRQPSHSNELVAAAVEHFGQLDSLIANAGIGMYGGILDPTDDDLKTMIDTNFTGTVWSVRAAVRQFDAAGKGGDIVVISSVAGFRGDANEAVYAGTKFAQVGLTGSIDRELRPRGIRVSMICPAGIETEFAIGRGRTEGDPSLAEYLRPEDISDMVRIVLEQPRRVRTTQWHIRPESQAS